MKPQFKLKTLLRNYFKRYIKLYLQGKKFQKSSYYIDFDNCFNHLGPPPDNDNKYHIDHIFPLKAFNFDDEIEIKIAWHFENLRWIKAEENLHKSSKYNKEEFLKFLIYMKEKYFKEVR